MINKYKKLFELIKSKGNCDHTIHTLCTSDCFLYNKCDKEFNGVTFNWDWKKQNKAVYNYCIKYLKKLIKNKEISEESIFDELL